MIETIFTNLTYALRENPYIAVFASFSCRILSILLRPSQLASIPLIVGFISSQGDKVTIKKAFILSLLF